MNSLLNKYAPFKKISRYKLKFKTKPWIKVGIQKPISVKNKLLKKFIKKRIHIQRLSVMRNIKNTETSFPRY